MPEYRELAPPPRLVDTVECFWIYRQDSAPDQYHRVVPDGCADIIYTRFSAHATLQFVAPMTRYVDFSQTPGAHAVGVRFRPAMWAETLRLNGRGLADRILAFDEVWGRRARELSNLLDSCEQAGQVARLLAQSLPCVGSTSPFQKAISALERSRGALSLNDAADAAGLSTRQFRRRCLEETSLSPNLLARILRFRYATTRAALMAGHHAELSAECGYSDQSHLIAEYRRFAGRTPGRTPCRLP